MNALSFEEALCHHPAGRAGSGRRFFAPKPPSDVTSFSCYAGRLNESEAEREQFRKFHRIERPARLQAPARSF